MDASSSQRRNQGKKHQWNAEEDAILIGCMLDLKNDPMWRGEGGNFKSGFLLQLEKMMANKIPNCGIKAQPHIHSRLKLLKQQYGAIYDMLNTSGFEWDDARKCIACDQDVWDNWVKSHRQASGLRNKPFLHLEELSIIFGKDRATGQRAEDPADAVAKILADAMNSKEEVQFVDPTGFESNNSIPQTHIGNPQQSASSSQNQSRPRKRKVSNEEEVALIGTLIETVSNLGVMFQGSSKGIDKLANCFQFLAHDQELKKKVYEAIAEIKDLELHESLMVKAGFRIARDSASLTYFFSLPQRLRKYLVLDVLGLSHS